MSLWQVCWRDQLRLAADDVDHQRSRLAHRAGDAWCGHGAGRHHASVGAWCSAQTDSAWPVDAAKCVSPLLVSLV